MAIPKYKNKKIMVNGIQFDSKKEAKRYQELKLMEDAGEITKLERQVKFDLLPNQKDPDGKVIERKVQYVADFVYMKNGKVCVEDVKGYRDGGAYRVFVIKRKLMLYRFGLHVIEI
jgi:hypothetical protein